MNRIFFYYTPEDETVSHGKQSDEFPAESCIGSVDLKGREPTTDILMFIITSLLQNQGFEDTTGLSIVEIPA
ncbi:MAG: hypothetical protein ACOH2T_19090 [Pseudomonas sp.]